jgi:hypothetical protein
MTVVAGDVEGGAAVVVLGVRPSSGVEQLPDRFEMSVIGSSIQSAVPIVVLDVEVGALGDE